MSVLEKTHSTTTTLFITLCTFACISFFACQSSGNQSQEEEQQQSDTSATTLAKNENALPIVPMEEPEEDEAIETDDFTETVELQVVEQIVVTPTKTVTKEDLKVDVKIVEQTTQTTQIPEAKQPTQPTQTQATTPARAGNVRAGAAQRSTPQTRVTAPGLLPTPMWVVIIDVTNTEAEAIRLSSQYWSLGYRSNYFWGPDYGVSEQVFKVFLGPFPNRQLAELFVQEKYPNAQVLYLN
ncbi:MAG: hypothetical protein LBU90_00095 [Bacteroidales bacterium]|jgi:hypothetical protein|nr:hypothetical protein [Bacteroidales bacterium]